MPAGDALTNPVPVVPVDPNPVPVLEASTAPAPTTTTIPKNRILVLKGRGFGHGRGLGQWGAFGYAKDFGWNYRKILDHYYGGTVAGQVSPKSAIGVRLTASDDKALTVFQPKGRLFTAPEGQEGFTMPPGLAGAQPATVVDVNAVVPVAGAPIPVANQTGTVGPTTPVADDTARCDTGDAAAPHGESRGNQDRVGQRRFSGQRRPNVRGSVVGTSGTAEHLQRDVDRGAD